MDDDFDYGALSLRTTTAYAVKADVQFISGTILLIFGIVGSFLVYAMLIYRRKKISIGVRYYAFFIVTCNLIYLVIPYLLSYLSGLFLGQSYRKLLVVPIYKYDARRGRQGLRELQPYDHTMV